MRQLDSRTDDAEVQVIMQYGNNPHVVLCTLHGRPPWQHVGDVDLTFEKGYILSFTTLGPSTVHLTGSLIPDDEEGNCEVVKSPPIIFSNCTETRGNLYQDDWIIQNVSDFSEMKRGQSLYSEIFHDETGEIKWKIKIFPEGEEKKNEIEEDKDFNERKEDDSSSDEDEETKKEELDRLTLYLCFDTEHSELVENHKITGYCHIKMWAEDISVKSMICIDKGITECRFGHRIGQDWRKILESNNGDDLIIHCEVFLFLEPYQLKETLERELLFDLEQCQLNDDFSKLLNEPNDFSDVVLIVGDEKFAAHKNVLAARSPVFAAMLKRKEMRENRENEIKIEQMEPIVVKAMLEFIYTDAVENLDELAPGLLAAADRYELRRLKVLCEKVLYKTLKVDNAAEYLVLTDLHHAYTLKERIIEFIKKHLQEVKASQEYEQLEESYSFLLS